MLDQRESSTRTPRYRIEAVAADEIETACYNENFLICQGDGGIDLASPFGVGRAALPDLGNHVRGPKAQLRVDLAELPVGQTKAFFGERGGREILANVILFVLGYRIGIRLRIFVH